MKTIISILLIFGILSFNSFGITNAATVSSNKQTNTLEQNTDIKNDAPVWDEYVAPKYRNPRQDFTKGGSLGELITGIVLTDLVLTAPIGIPLIIHGSTKLKMRSYGRRKNIFETEIANAQLIEDDTERAEAYKKTLKKCHLKESTRKHYARKAAKAQAKAEKKAAKQQKKKQSK